MRGEARGPAAEAAALGVRLAGELVERGADRILAAIREVPRHEFVPPAYRDFAYEDRPLPIGYGQTISQPLIVAIMSEMLAIEPGHRVFELGTGSGYQAAVLNELTPQVFTIEIIEALLAHPVVEADPTLSALLDRYAAEMLAKLPESVDLVQQVQRLEPRDHEGDAVPRSQLLVLGPAHDRADGCPEYAEPRDVARQVNIIAMQQQRCSAPIPLPV